MKKITAFPFTSKMTFDEKGWPQLDRGVTSEVLRKVLKNYYVNGVFGINDSACLQVAASMDDSAAVKVKPGVCFIQGATGYTEEEASLELTASDTSLPRIDTVVARLNDNLDYRAIYLDIITGTPAATPQPPALTRSDSIWEIGLANLYRTANSTVITNSNITDTRLDSSRCGYATAIDRLDTESLMQQLNAYYDEFVSQCETDYDISRQQYLLQCQNIIDDVISFKDATKEEILAWFQEMKDQLSEDAAGHLQVEIDELQEKLDEIETPDFDDSGEVEGINSFTDFMSSFVKKTSIYQLFANLKAGLQYVLHAGQLVNNGLCEEAGKFALDAAYGHTMTEQITQLYSEITDGLWTGEAPDGTEYTMQSFLDELFAKFHPAVINLITSVSDFNKSVYTYCNTGKYSNNENSLTIVDGMLELSAKKTEGTYAGDYVTVTITSTATYDVTCYDKIHIGGSEYLTGYIDYAKAELRISLKHKLTGAMTDVYTKIITSDEPINGVINREVNISSLTDEHYVVISLTGTRKGTSYVKLSVFELES